MSFQVSSSPTNSMTGPDRSSLGSFFFFFLQEYFIDGIENIQLKNKIIGYVNPKAGSHTALKGIQSLHPSLILGLTPRV